MGRNANFVFASFLQKGYGGVPFNLNAGDTLKAGIITTAFTPSVYTPDPRWGPGGGTNLSSFEAATHAGGYTGVINLDNPYWTLLGGSPSNGIIRLGWDNIAQIAQDAGGFTNGGWFIPYVDSVSGKYCIGALDLGGPVSLVAGPLTITLNALGFAIVTAAPPS